MHAAYGTGYGGLLTIAPWADQSGGKHHQLLFNNAGIQYRLGTYGQPGWEKWQKLVLLDSSNLMNVGISANTLSGGIRLGRTGDKGNIYVPADSATGGYNIDFMTWRDVAQSQVGGRIRGERINRYNNNNALTQGMDLVFYTSNGVSQAYLSEKMRIRFDGAVGIGTSRIPPGYKLAVYGKLIAEELKIKLPATGWPDFVFNYDYILMPLPMLRTFIETNKHLPEIPTADQVREEGIDVGANQALLLKKIEELTLYILEQDKRIVELELKMGEYNVKKTIILTEEQRKLAELFDF